MHGNPYLEPQLLSNILLYYQDKNIIGLYIIVSHLKITLLIRIYYILWNGPEFYCVIALTEMEILDFQCYVD